MKREAESILDFVQRSKKGCVIIQPYVTQKNGYFFPILEMESENQFYRRKIQKRFENRIEVEEFIENEAKNLSKEIFYQGFKTILKELKYTNERVKCTKEEDISYLLAGINII